MKKIAMLLVLPLLTFGLVACGDYDFPSPCEGLTVSERDRQAAADGYEVEREDSLGNECELSQDGNSWSVDD